MRGRLRAAAVCAAVVVGLTVMANEKPSPEYQTAMKNLGCGRGIRAAGADNGSSVNFETPLIFPIVRVRRAA